MPCGASLLSEKFGLFNKSQGLLCRRALRGFASLRKVGCPQEGADRKGAVQFNDLYVSNYVGLPRLRHANTMPTHENAHHKGAAAFGGGPLRSGLFKMGTPAKTIRNPQSGWLAQSGPIRNPQANPQSGTQSAISFLLNATEMRFGSAWLGHTKKGSAIRNPAIRNPSKACGLECKRPAKESIGILMNP